MLQKTAFSKILLGFVVVFSVCAASFVFAVVSVPKGLALQTQVGIDSLMGSVCQTGYTRVAPHLCQVDSFQTGTFLITTNTTCHALDMHAGYNYPNPAVGYANVWLIPSSPVFGVTFYNDSGCTTTYINATTSLANPTMYTIRTINGNIYYKSGGAGGDSLRWQISPVLYYD